MKILLNILVLLGLTNAYAKTSSFVTDNCPEAKESGAAASESGAGSNCGACMRCRK